MYGHPLMSHIEDEIYGEFTYAYLNAAVNSDTPCTTNATMTTWYTLYATNKSFFFFNFHW